MISQLVTGHMFADGRTGRGGSLVTFFRMPPAPPSEGTLTSPGDCLVDAGTCDFRLTGPFSETK